MLKIGFKNLHFRQNWTISCSLHLTSFLRLENFHCRTSSSESETERPKKRKRAISNSSSDVATSSSNEELVESIPPPASPTVPDVDTSQPGPSQPTETPPADPAQEIPGRRDDDVEGTTPTSDWNFGLKKYCTNKKYAMYKHRIWCEPKKRHESAGLLGLIRK